MSSIFELPLEIEAYADRTDRLVYHDILIDDGREDVAALLAEGEKLLVAGVVSADAIQAAWHYAALPPSGEGPVASGWRRQVFTGRTPAAAGWGIRLVRAVEAEWGRDVTIHRYVVIEACWGQVRPQESSQNAEVWQPWASVVWLTQTDAAKPAHVSVISSGGEADCGEIYSLHYEPAWGWIVIHPSGVCRAVKSTRPGQPGRVYV